MKGDSIFVDSNYFVALFNKADYLHKKAVELAKAIDRGSTISLVVSNLVFLEIVTVLSQRVNKAVSVEVGGYLLNDPMISFLHIDESLQEESWKIFSSVKEKNVSFVDCSIIAAMQVEGIRELLSFDKKDFGNLKKFYKFRLLT